LSALIKLNMPSRWSNYLRVQPAAEVLMRNTSTGLAVELAGGVLTYAAGEKAGEEVEGTQVKANQKVFLPLGSMKPAKFHALLEVNPKFYLEGTVGFPRIVEPGQEIDLVLSFRADKAVDFADIPWIARIYLID
jgi:hypothetical protein